MKAQTVGSNVNIGELINSTEYAAELRDVAQDLSQSVTPLLDEPGRLRLLETSAIAAPIFVRSELQSLGQAAPLTLEKKKQAELASTQAATLSGSMAILHGEDPVGLYEDYLTTGEPVDV